MKPVNFKELQGRAKTLRASRINRRTYVVQSLSSQTANHIVTLDYTPDDGIQARCTCPWAINGGVACTHVIAVLEKLAERRGRRLSFWTSENEAQRQKRRRFYLKGGKPSEGVWITSRTA